MNQTKLDGILYDILPENQVRDYVVEVCEKEWSAQDFPVVGEDLYKSSWKLEEVEVAKITPNAVLLLRDSFQADLKPRIVKQAELHALNAAIPPLILRGKDLFIFDGYARYHFFKSIGVRRCLAYVGRRA